MAKVIQFNEDITLLSGKKIREITITDAMKEAGVLRGLKLYDVMVSDVNALMTLLPRVTSPRLEEVELGKLPVYVFAKIASEVVSFLDPNSTLNETTPNEATSLNP